MQNELTAENAKYLTSKGSNMVTVTERLRLELSIIYASMKSICIDEGNQLTLDMTGFSKGDNIKKQFPKLILNELLKNRFDASLITERQSNEKSTLLIIKW